MQINTEQATEFKPFEQRERASTCTHHGDFTEKGVSLSGRSMTWQGCTVCHAQEGEARKERKALEEQILQQQRIEARMKTAGIPLRFRDKTLENYIAATPAQTNSLTTARDFVENFDENYKAGKTLIFSGKAGTGKSHLAIAIAQAVMPKYTALYLNTLDAVRMIRDTWRKDSALSELQVLEMFGTVGLLVIDEVGVQYGTDNEQMLIFEIINRRYRDSMPMILLTNLGTKGFSEYLTERSYDRLRENGQWVKFDWASHRAKLKAVA